MAPTPVIFLVAGLLATLILWRQGGLEEIGASLRELSPWKALAILLAYTATILLLGGRWHVLARMAGGAPSWTSSVEVFLTSVIVNYAAPIGLAVPTRAALTVRDLGLTPAQSAAVVGWELALDVVALLIVSALWLALGGTALLQTMAFDRNAMAVALGLLVAVALVAVVCLLLASVRARLQRLLRPMLANPLRSPGLALAAAGMTGGYWAAQSAIMAALLAIFGTPPSAPLVLGVMGLPMLIGMLSPVPGGAGVREALMAGAARLEGLAAGPVVLAAITYRLALFVVTPIAWGIVRVARRLATGR
ncbi:MAG: flippase-like domain-containing protein [Thermomicrobiales bacterium]|nr:flippase-like domain-containing protein [Thermomicrobiales bacterium]